MIAGDSNSHKVVVLGVLFTSAIALMGVLVILVSRNLSLPRVLLPRMEMPGPLPPGYSPARPVGSPGQWFTRDAYPADAVRAGHEGRVATMIAVDAEGRPRRCEVSVSSGHESLDRAACEGVMRNGSYRPAQAPDGTPVPSRIAGPPVRWQLED